MCGLVIWQSLFMCYLEYKYFMFMESRGREGQILLTMGVFMYHLFNLLRGVSLYKWSSYNYKVRSYS